MIGTKVYQSHLLQRRFIHIPSSVEAFEAEEAHKKECLKKFEALVQETIANGAGNEETALRWLSQNDTFYHIQDIESWVWDHGILFTDYGRKLVKKLEGLVTFKDWETA